MRCLAPFVAWRRKERAGVTLRYAEGDPRFSLLLPCGTCAACLLERARQHAVKVVNEAELHDRSCFVTLTYDDEHLPYGGSLVKSDFQKFVKSVRNRFGSGIRFFGCGEYGTRWQRPHYHVIFFGVDFVEDRYVSGKRAAGEVFRSPSLEGLWPVGRSEIGTVTFESAGYVARYVAKKLGEKVLDGREPEFLLMSLRPGLGVPWLERYYRSVYARDSVVVRGAECKPPRLYDKWLEREHPELYRVVKRRREAERLARGDDPDDRSSRWEVMEECLLAKLNLFAREVEQ